MNDVWAHSALVQHCSASSVAKRWIDLFPDAFAVVQRLLWTVSIDGGRIDRVDSFGVRRQFVIGLGSPRIIFEWLVDVLQFSPLPGVCVNHCAGTLRPRPLALICQGYLTSVGAFFLAIR